MVSELIHDQGPAILNVYLFVLEFLSAAALAVSLIALFILIRSLVGLGLAGKKAYVYPVCFMVLKAVNLILSAWHSMANLNAFIESCGTLLLYAAMLFFLCERRRRAEALLSEVTDDPE